MSDLIWKGDKLHRNGSKRPLITIEPDSIYPNMWRVRTPSGELTDMCNKARAKEAARNRCENETN